MTGSATQAAGDTPHSHPMPLNADNRFWAEAVKRGMLPIQKCEDCGRLRHPPGPMCPHCQSLNWGVVAASGRGAIYSYTVHHRPEMDGFERPFTILLVELEEGVRMVGNLVDAANSDIAIGMNVLVTFVRNQGTGQVLPQWRLADGDAG